MDSSAASRRQPEAVFSSKKRASRSSIRPASRRLRSVDQPAGSPSRGPPLVERGPHRRGVGVALGGDLVDERADVALADHRPVATGLGERPLELARREPVDRRRADPHRLVRAATGRSSESPWSTHHEPGSAPGTPARASRASPVMAPPRRRSSQETTSRRSAPTSDGSVIGRDQSLTSRRSTSSGSGATTSR